LLLRLIQEMRDSRHGLMRALGGHAKPAINRHLKTGN
jgi:hypothetical protein